MPNSYSGDEITDVISRVIIFSPLKPEKKPRKKLKIYIF